ncbi:unnamed protein product [Heligmosomoides polygyrus]|uniref:Endo/exonuclease/phosphatase domain-containing protein n=1 Tax=Heligmosomoides polygyrus TaxID=6339 RepID=A0A183F7F2_HELPZ|nr:unnamed protein product [Heligmosomoides polygyrus]
METKMLRWTAGITRLDRVRNESVRQRFGVTPIFEKMREARLQWYGHVLRAKGDTVRKTGLNLDVPEVEAFYVELEKFYKEDHTFYKVIVGDLNAKIGPRWSPEELHIGIHGLEWNEQGERLSEFIMLTKTIHGNSQFQKPPSLRWTWKSPCGQFHNEVDHIIFNRKYCLTDVSVVPNFYTGSDYRLLRARFRYSRQGEKAMKFKKRSPRTTINWDL